MCTRPNLVYLRRLPSGIRWQPTIAHIHSREQGLTVLIDELFVYEPRKSMAHAVCFERVEVQRTTHGTLTQPEHGTNNVISRLPHYDLLSFLAILQDIPSVRLFDFMPRFDNKHVKRGLSGQVHSIVRDHEDSIAFKRFRSLSSNNNNDTKAAFKALIGEIIVLEHPVFKKHPNLPKLLGIAWDVEYQDEEHAHAMPVLVFRHAKLGNLRDYLGSESSLQLTLKQKLQLCLDIGQAIEALHTFNIVHGDIKPENVLVEEEKSGRLVAQVIDFGCSCFGTTGNDMVCLAYTPEWVAPEWRAGPFSVDEAKRTDVYSYGKVCSWIMFGRHAFPHERVDARFDYDRALEAQPLAENDPSPQHRAKSALRQFFELSLESDPYRRTTDLSKLLELLQVSSPAITRGQRLSIPMFRTSIFRRLNFYPRVQVGRLLAYCLLGRESEFFAPGQAQAKFYLTKAFPIPAVIIVVYAICASLFWIIPYIASSWSRSSLLSANHVILWIYLGLMLLAAVYLWRMRHATFWIDLRDSSHTFRVFGRRQHLVPNIPRLLPLLDSLHYLIRVQVVKDLITRQESACEECKAASALQLAFCFEFAFGTSRDPVVSQKWLKKSGKKRADVLRLSREAVHYTDIYRVRRLLGKRVEFQDPITATIQDQYESPDLMRKAVIACEKEITGREASGCPTLVDDLTSLCGHICTEIYHHEKAEEMHRKALRAWLGKKPFRNWPLFSDVWNGSSDHCGGNLAFSLRHQRRNKEAIDVLLKHSRSVLQKPNGRESWLHLTRGGKRHTMDRILLARLLIEEGRLEQALKLEMPSDIQDLLTTGNKNSEEVYDIFSNMSILVDALRREKQMAQATTLQRQQLALTEVVFGIWHDETHDAMWKLGFLLSQQTSDERAEAVNLLKVVGQKRNDTNDVIALKALYAQAFAMGRQGHLQDALSIMQGVRETLMGLWESDHPERAMGSMGHLACSLSIHGEDGLTKPSSIQQAISDICRHSHHAGIQHAAFLLLFMLSRPEAIEEVLQLMRELIKLMEDLHQNTSTSYYTIVCSFVFLLSAYAFLFESRTDLIEATDTSNHFLETVKRSFGDYCLEYLEAIALHASLCAKRALLLYHDHGFGPQDLQLMNSTVAIHRELLTLSINLLGEDHDDTLMARINCARSLSVHGLAIGDIDERAEAEALLCSVYRSNSNKLGSEHHSTLWVRSLLEGSRHRHGTIKNTDAEDYQRYYLRKLQERLNSTHPFRIMQEFQLTCMLLQSGNARDKALKMARDTYGYFYVLHGKLHPMAIYTLETIGSFEQQKDKSGAVIKARRIFWRAQGTFDTVKEPHLILRYRNLLVKSIDSGGQDDSNVLKMQEEILRSAINLFGKQNTSTIRIMVQLSQMLLQRGQRLTAFHTSSEALSLAAGLVGIRQELVARCWKCVLSAIEYGESNKAILEAKLDRIVVSPLQTENMTIAGDDLVRSKEDLCDLASLAGLSFNILGKNHSFSLKTYDSFREALTRISGVSPKTVEETIDLANDCVDLPSSMERFLERCSDPGDPKQPLIIRHNSVRSDLRP